MTALKQALVFAVSALAIAPSAIGQAVLHADGFKENPPCGTVKVVTATLADNKEFATGVKAVSPRFDLEIFAQKGADGQFRNYVWTLVGDDRKGNLCMLTGSDTRPYTKHPLVNRYFKQEK